MYICATRRLLPKKFIIEEFSMSKEQSSEETSLYGKGPYMLSGSPSLGPGLSCNFRYGGMASYGPRWAWLMIAAGISLAPEILGKNEADRIQGLRNFLARGKGQGFLHVSLHVYQRSTKIFQLKTPRHASIIWSKVKEPSAT